MVNPNATYEWLKQSGLAGETYTLPNARKFASLIVGIYSSGELEEAVRDALNEQEQKNAPGRLQVFIGCDHSIIGGHVADCLVEPRKYIFKKGGSNAAKEIYGTTEDAFNGTTKSGEPHASFFVYDTNAAVVVDLVGRNGKSLLPAGVRNVYLSSLEESLGYSITREEKPLVDNPLEEVKA